MGILKSAADLVYTIRFLKMLVTPFEKLGAFKYGIIDKDGNKLIPKDSNWFLDVENRRNYSAHYTSFIRLVINLKKLMAKVPGGKSIIARYGAALLLIKEDGDLSDKQINMIHEETGIDILDCLVEQTQWYMLEGKKLSHGVYRSKFDGVITSGEDIVTRGDKIRVVENKALPIDSVLGIDIYEGIHLNSGQRFLFSTGEIEK
tara:strand:+ start:1675 stop:2283 length:609 start_codon:yes stop_codon:yes gene_type:complete